MRRQRGRAFTLIELVTVVIIIGLLASMAIPRYANFTGRQRVDAAARRIAVDLSFAQQRAQSSSTSQTVQFDVAENSYRLIGVPDQDRPGVEYAVSLSNEPYRAEIISADFGGDGLVVFDGYGTPDSGGTVIVQWGSIQKTVVLDADTGKANVP